MKCPCGFNERPDNITKLRDHLVYCQKKGNIPPVKKGYLIVWRDGELTITDKKKAKETVFETELPEGKTPGLTTKVGLPTYTPTESLLAPQKTRVNAVGEKEEKKPKKKKR